MKAEPNLGGRWRCTHTCKLSSGLELQQTAWRHSQAWQEVSRSPFSELLSLVQAGRLSAHNQLVRSWWLLMKTLNREGTNTSLLSSPGLHSPFHLVRSLPSMTNSVGNISWPVSQLKLFQETQTLRLLSPFQLHCTPRLRFLCCRHNFYEHKRSETECGTERKCRITTDIKTQTFQNGDQRSDCKWEKDEG